MNENEQELARKIVRHLERGLDEIRPDMWHRLQAVRLSVLARYHEPQPTLGPVWAGHIGRFFHRGRLTAAHYAFAATLLVISAVGITYWQTANDEETEVDVSLLTGDVPINAYLDSDFEAWLKRSSE